MLTFCQNSFIQETALIIAGTYQWKDAKANLETKPAITVCSSIVKEKADVL